MDSIKNLIGNVRTGTPITKTTNSSDYSTQTTKLDQTQKSNKYSILKRADSENYFYIM
jgi:hypothetical protein